MEGTTDEWWQTHVRGREHPDGIALHGHRELEPTENDDHIDGEFPFDRGMENLRAALDDTSVPVAGTRIE